MEELKDYVGRIKRLIYRCDVNIETAHRTVDTANKLSPLDVKREMYKPLLHFEEALPYETAAENVALKKVREQQRLESVMSVL